MNENNLVRRLSYLTPGDGYRKCFPLDILADVKDATGLVLTAATVPAIAALEPNFYGLSAASTGLCLTTTTRRLTNSASE